MQYLIDVVADNGYLIEAQVDVLSWNKLNPDDIEFDFFEIAIYDDDDNFVVYIDEADLTKLDFYAIQAELIEKLLDETGE